MMVTKESIVTRVTAVPDNLSYNTRDNDITRQGRSGYQLHQPLVRARAIIKAKTVTTTYICYVTTQRTAYNSTYDLQLNE
jgi:hypothetical protein